MCSGHQDGLPRCVEEAGAPGPVLHGGSEGLRPRERNKQRQNWKGARPTGLQEWLAGGWQGSLGGVRL